MNNNRAMVMMVCTVFMSLVSYSALIIFVFNGWIICGVLWKFLLGVFVPLVIVTVCIIIPGSWYAATLKDKR